MSISDFEQSLWELALLINPTHLANITTSKLNSYYQDTILDMRKVVLVQNLFNDIYNNWTDHQIRYQQNRRRQIENGEITEQQLLEEESEENESEIEYISEEEGQEMMVDEGYDPEQDVDMEDNKENIDVNNGNVIVANDNTIIQLPVRKDSVSHKSNGKPIKKTTENQSIVDNKIEQSTVESVTSNKKSKDIAVEKSKSESKASSKSSKDMKKKASKNEMKEQKAAETKENVKKITLDFSGKDAKTEESKKSNETSVTEDKETQKKSKKEHSRRKKIEREPRKDSLKANVKLSDEKSSEVIKELQKSGVIHMDKTSEEKAQKNFNKSDSAVSLDEKTESSINSVSSSNTSGSSFVIRSFNIPSQHKTETTEASSTPATTINTNKPLPAKQEPTPSRKSSAVPPYKKNKTYKLSDKNVSIKNKYKLEKSDDVKEVKKQEPEPKVHLRPKKITANDAGMPPAMQRRSMDELLFQFADVMDIVSLIPHIVGDDDLLGNDLTFNSSDLNSKVQTKDSNGNVVEEAPRRRPSRAPTPPPTVVSNGKEYEVYSIPSERHQKYIKKKEEMEKSNKRRSSLKFEYHEFEELRKQQELAGYDTTGDVPVTERKTEKKKEISQPVRSSSKTSATYKRANTSAASNNSYSTAGSCGSAMKMDVLSPCMSSSSSNSNSNSGHSSSNKSSTKRSSRFFNLTKSSKSKSKDKEKEKEKEKEKNSSSSANKENVPSNSNSNKSYLERRKSGDKAGVRSYQRYKLGSNSPESSPSQPSPTLSSVSSSSTGSKSSSVKKSYSSTTLSKYDLPHMSSLSSEGSSRRYAGSSSERERERERSSSKQTLPSVKSSPGLFEGINLSSSSSSSSTSSKHRPKKATDHKSSSTSEIDKFFDNVFRIDWSL